MANGLGLQSTSVMSPRPKQEYEVAGQTFVQMFHSLSRSWLLPLLCEDDTVSHWSKQNKSLPTVAVKMNINTELSLDAWNFPVLFSLSAGNSCNLVHPAFYKTMNSDFWRMSKGHVICRREAEVNINKGRRRNVESDLRYRSCSHSYSCCWLVLTSVWCNPQQQ